MKDSVYRINMNTISFKAFCALQELDKSFIGSPEYLGIAYFWGSNGCKYYLREASVAQRRRVHHLWVKAGLDLAGETLEHYKIIQQVTKLAVPTTREELQ
jgi:hypothetical protein